MEILYISVLFFIVAVLYSSAGFGGGSSYLAILTLFGLEYVDLRMVALLCNIAVVSSSVFLFYKNDLLHLRRLWPLVLCSVPLAFLGGNFLIDQKSFFILLGLTLLISALLMFVDTSDRVIKLPKFSNAFIGGGIGFLAGMVGIGGGIFLSPVLHLSRWDTPKVIASTCAFFIWVNSFAGLAGQAYAHGFSMNLFGYLPLILAVIVGGQIGVRLTLFNFDQNVVKRMTSLVIALVAIRILISYI